MSQPETEPPRGSQPATTPVLGSTGQPDRPSQAVSGGRTARSSSSVCPHSIVRASQAGQLASQSVAPSKRLDNTHGAIPPGAEPAGRPASTLDEEDSKRPAPMKGAVSQQARKPAAPPTARLDATRSVALRPGPASAESVTRSTAAPALAPGAAKSLLMGAPPAEFVAASPAGTEATVSSGGLPVVQSRPRTSASPESPLSVGSFASGRPAGTPAAPSRPLSDELDASRAAFDAMRHELGTTHRATSPGTEPEGRPASTLDVEDLVPAPSTDAVSQPAMPHAAPTTARFDATRCVMRPDPMESVTRSTAALPPGSDGVVRSAGSVASGLYDFVLAALQPEGHVSSFVSWLSSSADALLTAAGELPLPGVGPVTRHATARSPPTLLHPSQPSAARSVPQTARSAEQGAAASVLSQPAAPPQVAVTVAVSGDPTATPSLPPPTLCLAARAASLVECSATPHVVAATAPSHQVHTLCSIAPVTGSEAFRPPPEPPPRYLVTETADDLAAPRRELSAEPLVVTVATAVPCVKLNAVHIRHASQSLEMWSCLCRCRSQCDYSVATVSAASLSLAPAAADKTMFAVSGIVAPPAVRGTAFDEAAEVSVAPLCVNCLSPPGNALSVPPADASLRTCFVPSAHETSSDSRVAATPVANTGSDTTCIASQSAAGSVPSRVVVTPAAGSATCIFATPAAGIAASCIIASPVSSRADSRSVTQSAAGSLRVSFRVVTCPNADSVGSCIVLQSAVGSVSSSVTSSRAAASVDTCIAAQSAAAGVPYSFFVPSVTGSVDSRSVTQSAAGSLSVSFRVVTCPTADSAGPRIASQSAVDSMPSRVVAHPAGGSEAFFAVLQSAFGAPQFVATPVDRVVALSSVDGLPTAGCVAHSRRGVCRLALDFPAFRLLALFAALEALASLHRLLLAVRPLGWSRCRTRAALAVAPPTTGFVASVGDASVAYRCVAVRFADPLPPAFDASAAYRAVVPSAALNVQCVAWSCFARFHLQCARSVPRWCATFGGHCGACKLRRPPSCCLCRWQCDAPSRCVDFAGDAASNAAPHLVHTSPVGTELACRSPSRCLTSEVPRDLRNTTSAVVLPAATSLAPMCGALCRTASSVVVRAHCASCSVHTCIGAFRHRRRGSFRLSVALGLCDAHRRGTGTPPCGSLRRRHTHSLWPVHRASVSSHPASCAHHHYLGFATSSSCTVAPVQPYTIFSTVGVLQLYGYR